jgi:hypothetical protein
LESLLLDHVALPHSKGTLRGNEARRGGAALIHCLCCLQLSRDVGTRLRHLQLLVIFNIVVYAVVHVLHFQKNMRCDIAESFSGNVGHAPVGCQIAGNSPLRPIGRSRVDAQSSILRIQLPNDGLRLLAWGHRVMILFP